MYYLYISFYVISVWRHCHFLYSTSQNRGLSLYIVGVIDWDWLTKDT